MASEKRIAREVNRRLTSAIKMGERDIDRLDHLIDPLWDALIGLSGKGTATYRRYVRYIATFDEKAAKERQDDFECMLGYKLIAVYAAADLAYEWHKGQTDKAGKDYFFGHLASVSRGCHGWKAKVVGFLHDTAEDTPHTVEEIIAALRKRLTILSRNLLERSNLIDRYLELIDEIPNEKFHPLSASEYEEIAEALRLLNSSTAPSREAYIERFRGNVLAIGVKLSDMRHNMDLSRLPSPTEKDLMRQRRYEKEYRKLLEMLDEVYPMPE